MEPMPPPMPVPELLASLIRLVNDFQRKNVTMINYYIQPSPVPTEIAAYEPRLLIYRTRIQNIALLDINRLASLVDDAVPLIISYTLPSVSDLAAASMGIQKIFIEHYDRRLEQSLPYDTIFQTLRLYEHNLRETMPQLMGNPRRQPAEMLVPPATAQPSLCRGATAFINNRDRGKVSNVSSPDLLAHHRSRLADKGGVVLWWECPECAFRLRYHASNSANLSINHTDEIVLEDNVDNIAFRSAWLVKCHIYHPRPLNPPVPSPPMSPRQRRSEQYSPTSPVTPTSPRFSNSTRPNPPPKRVSFTRRTSSTLSATKIVTETTTSRVRTRSPDPPSPKLSRSQSHDYDYNNPHAPHRNSTSRSHRPRLPKEPTGANGLRYYCPFCIAQGKPMMGPPPAKVKSRSTFPSRSASTSSSSSSDARDNYYNDNNGGGGGTRRRSKDHPTCFEDSQDLIEHIDDKHTRDRPTPLLLQKLKVAIEGKMAPGPEKGMGRWDLDLR